METYNFDVSPLRFAAADWFDEQIQAGRLVYEISTRGNSRQFVVSPQICSLLQEFYPTGKSKDDEYYIFYQVEIKCVKGLGTATMRLTCHQAPDMPDNLRDFYINTLLPQMRRAYRKNGLWYDMMLNSIKITPDTGTEELRMFLETGLIRGEYFERKLFDAIENTADYMEGRL